MIKYTTQSLFIRNSHTKGGKDMRGIILSVMKYSIKFLKNSLENFKFLKNSIKTNYNLYENNENTQQLIRINFSQVCEDFVRWTGWVWWQGGSLRRNYSWPIVHDLSISIQLHLNICWCQVVRSEGLNLKNSHNLKVMFYSVGNFRT